MSGEQQPNFSIVFDCRTCRFRHGDQECKECDTHFSNWAPPIEPQRNEEALKAIDRLVAHAEALKAQRPDRAEALAAAHWEYVESVIRAEWDGFATVAAFDPTHLDAHCKIIGHHFRTAFAHGYKHGKDDKC